MEREGELEAALRAAAPPAQDATFMLAVLERIEREAASRSRIRRLLEPGALLSTLGLAWATVQGVYGPEAIDVELLQTLALVVGCSLLVTRSALDGGRRGEAGL